MMTLLRISLRSSHILERIQYTLVDVGSYRTVCGLNTNSVMELVMSPYESEHKDICLACLAVHKTRQDFQKAFIEKGEGFS